MITRHEKRLCNVRVVMVRILILILILILKLKVISLTRIIR